MTSGQAERQSCFCGLAVLTQAAVVTDALQKCSPGNSEEARGIAADRTIGWASSFEFERIRSVRRNPKDFRLVKLRGWERVTSQRFNCNIGPR